MPFPTTQFLPVGEFSMVAAVLRLTPSECRFIDLFPNPSLSCLDFCSAVGACVGVAGDHFSPPSQRCDAIVESKVIERTERLCPVLVTLAQTQATTNCF